jgi:hydroxymethylbilane synthase
VSPRDKPPIRIATRGSALALWQARNVAGLIRHACPDCQVDLVEVTTTGDRVQSQPLRDFGGTGAFTREVQSAVLDGRADVAVHSLKDLPTESTPGLLLASVPPREVTDDALVLPSGPSIARLEELPMGARIGTGSPRRQAQLRHLRADLEVSEVRGNIETRLRKLDAGDFDALVLAAAGLIRLGLDHRITQRLTPPQMYAAVSQGAIGVECRSDDDDTAAVLAHINDRTAWATAIAERTLLASLRAGCHAPVGALSTLEEDRLRLDAVVLSLDGSRRWTASGVGRVDDPAAVGAAVAAQLLSQGAFEVL